MIVLKFGGTSMGSIESLNNVVSIIQDVQAQQPIIVASAMGGVTNQLLDAAAQALEGNDEVVESCLLEITNRHQDVLLHFLNDQQEAQAFFRTYMQPLFQELSEIYQGISLLKELSDQSVAVISSFGERLSTFLLQAICESQNISTQRFDTRQLVRTSSQPLEASVDFEVTRNLFQEHVAPVISNGVIPILTGFIGSDQEGNTTTLGRGGSDYSAAIAAVSLDATEVQIWTDVNGILSTDPRIVSEAETLSEISFNEAAELAYFGAKVLHPKTIQPAVQENIPVKILNTFEPSHPGTLISNTVHNGLKAISLKKGISIVNICSSRMLEACGFMEKIYRVFAHHNIATDVTTTSEVSVSVSIDQACPQEVLDELNEFAHAEVTENLAIVCLVGEGITSDRNMLADIFNELRDVDVHIVSQGASRRNITFLVDESVVEGVLRKLYDKCFMKTVNV